MEWKKQLTIPNFLTCLRFLAIPWLVYLSCNKINSKLSLVVFIGIWLTDLLDGYIARRYNQISNFGKILDPLVDKIFQFATAIAMFGIGRLPVWVPIFIFVKELIMIVGSAILWQRQTVVTSQWFGKLATVLFAICFAVLFVLPPSLLYTVNYIFMVPAVVAILASVKYSLYYFGKRPWTAFK